MACSVVVVVVPAALVGELRRGVRRRALVEGDVVPVGRRDVVAPPLVHDLVVEGPAGAVGEERPVLGLEGVVDGAGDHVGHDAGAVARVGPVLRLVEVEERLELGPGDLGGVLVGDGDGRVDERPLVDGAVAELEVDVGLVDVVAADRDDGELAGHLLGLVPHPRGAGAVTVGRPGDQLAIAGHAGRVGLAAGVGVVRRLQHGGGVDGERVGRLVARRVVVGEQRHRADRLVDEGRAVGGVVPALGRAVRVEVDDRGAVSGHDGRERTVSPASPE